MLNFKNYLIESLREDVLKEVTSIILYHGTNSEFEKFDIKYFNSGSSDGGWIGKGFYFTNDYDYARSYADYKEGYILNVKLNIKNPYILTNQQYSTRPLKLKNKLKANNSTEVTDKLKSFGYDSVILTYLESEERQYEVCVFNPNDIQIVKVERSQF